MKVVHKTKPVLTEEEKELVRTMTKVRKVNSEFVSKLSNFMRKHIDSKVVICASCVAQIKFAIKSIQSFVDKWDINIEPTVDVDISQYHLGGAYWEFDGVKVKGKQEAIDYYINNVK